MGEVIYAMGVSVDGYAKDAAGGYGWSAPPDEVHAIANRQLEAAGAMVVGRRMFETMDVWRTIAEEAGHPPVMAEFAAAYVATPRHVVSDTLGEAPGATVVRRADARGLVQRLRDDVDGHVELGGPTLAGALVDLVDEFRMWVNPVVVGGGTPFFPHRADPLRLALVEHRAFPGGTLYLRYRRA